MKQRVESALEKGNVSFELASSEEERQMFKKWKEFSGKDHPSVIQVRLYFSLPLIHIHEYNSGLVNTSLVKDIFLNYTQILVKSSKDRDITGQAMPNLIYFSREKRPNFPHHFKAGALNALVRSTKPILELWFILCT